MKVNLQSKLLRVLEERKVRRLGGREEIPVEVTVIATTNRNLAEAVEQREFRMDLFYRLNAFSLHILPLRDRRDDIMPLARHFLSYFAAEYRKSLPKTFSSEAEELLYSHSWPGNVRELKNVIERIVVLENEEVVTPAHLPVEIAGPVTTCISSQYRCMLPDAGLSLEEVERDLIMQALDKAGGKKGLAAKLLNITYDSLRYHVKKFGFE
jgi:transcriptional regulator with PAS, ATPase and Fis domain